MLGQTITTGKHYEYKQVQIVCKMFCVLYHLSRQTCGPCELEILQRRYQLTQNVDDRLDLSFLFFFVISSITELDCLLEKDWKHNISLSRLIGVVFWIMETIPLCQAIIRW